MNIKRISAVILLSLLAPTTLLAQEANNSKPTESLLIERVIIRGNRRIPESMIKSCIAIRKGDSYSPERLDDAVRSLFASGHFEDVRVYAEDGLHGGRIVTFEVSERPLILEIVYEGIDQATQAEAREEWRKQKIDLSQDSEYDAVKVKRAAAIIQDLLVRRGNQRAKVNPMVEQQTATAVSIVFKVEE